jgi:hypothetical protein
MNTFRDIRTKFGGLARVLHLVYLDNGGNHICPFEHLNFPVGATTEQLAAANEVINKLNHQQQTLLASDPETLQAILPVELNSQLDELVEPVITPLFDGPTSMFSAARGHPNLPPTSQSTGSATPDLPPAT